MDLKEEKVPEMRSISGVRMSFCYNNMMSLVALLICMSSVVFSIFFIHGLQVCLEQRPIVGIANHVPSLVKFHV